MQVIKQCALERDLELFESGDSTEVGERGLTLRYQCFLYEQDIKLTNVHLVVGRRYVAR